MRAKPPPLAARLSGLMCQLENAVEAEPVGRAPIIRESGLYTALARDGRIEFSVSGHNWRTVKILVGPNAGKSTAPEPNGHRIYMVCDKAGPRRLALEDTATRLGQGKDKLLERLEAARADRKP